MISTRILSNRPLIIRGLSRLGHMYQQAGGTIDLSEEALMAAAMQRTELSDWGDDNFREGLRVLLHSYEIDAHLSLLGRYLIRADLTRILSNRLSIQQELTRHPEILREKICRPLFITGMPRTGSTLLHRLLAQDPNSRTLRLWEAINPIPPPDKKTKQSDPRIAKLERHIRLVGLLLPKLTAIHTSNASSPEECGLLLRHHIPAPNGHEVLANAISYKNWAYQQDMTPTYRYYRQQLQLLQWRSPGTPWILKAPGHLSVLDALLKVFPDACLIQTHRDPLTVIASYTSLKFATMSITSDDVNLKQVGQIVTDRFAKEVGRGLQIRAVLNSARIYDVFYDELVANPITTAHQIYTHFGYKITSKMEYEMKVWVKQNPQHRHGIHHYALDQFGLDRTTIQKRFVNYYKTFPTLHKVSSQT